MRLGPVDSTDHQVINYIHSSFPGGHRYLSLLGERQPRTFNIPGFPSAYLEKHFLLSIAHYCVKGGNDLIHPLEVHQIHFVTVIYNCF